MWPGEKKSAKMFVAYPATKRTGRIVEVQVSEIAVIRPFELHCVTCSTSIEWRATDVTPCWPAARLLRNNVLDWQRRNGRGVPCPRCEAQARRCHQGPD